MLYGGTRLLQNDSNRDRNFEMVDNKLPSEIDRIVGQRIRWRRKELRLTQDKLGELLSLTFQQVQKYEKGINRISAGRLFELANVLDVPITYFYEGAEDLVGSNGGVAENGHTVHVPVLNAETLDLIAAFQKIPDASLRRSLLNTVKAAASAFDEPTEVD